MHARPTPLVGGLAAAAGLATAVLGQAVLLGELPLFVLAASGLVAAGFALGAADDRADVPATVRLATLTSIAVLTVLLVDDLNVRVLHLHLLGLDQGEGQGLWWLSVPFTVFALMCLQNGLNMADGIDGLAPGLLLGLLGLIFPWAVAYTPELVPLVLCALVCLVVVLGFNLAGALFLGDAGTYGVSLFVGLLAIYVYNAADGAVSAELVALWFLIPVLDMGRLLVQRMRAGRHPFSADREHLHHLLLRVADKRTAVALYLILALLPAALVTVEALLLPFAVVGAVAGYIAVVARNGRHTAARDDYAQV